MAISEAGYERALKLLSQRWRGAGIEECVSSKSVALDVLKGLDAGLDTVAVTLNNAIPDNTRLPSHAEPDAEVLPGVNPRTQLSTARKAELLEVLAIVRREEA